MRIGIASDHGGYKLKQKLIFKLKKIGYEVFDCGTYSEERTDYQIYAFKLCDSVLQKKVNFGVAICTTGIGMSIACNKVDGIMCAKVDSINDAKAAKEHNEANVLALSGRAYCSKAIRMINKYNSSKPLEDERYELRREMIRDYENEH